MITNVVDLKLTICISKYVAMENLKSDPQMLYELGTDDTMYIVHSTNISIYNKLYNHKKHIYSYTTFIDNRPCYYLKYSCTFVIICNYSNVVGIILQTL